MSEEQNKDLFIELGLENASDGDKAKLIEALQSALQDRMMMRLGEILSEDQKNNLSKFTEENKDKPLSILNFIMNMVPNYESILNEEALKLRQELIADYKNAKK